MSRTEHKAVIEAGAIIGEGSTVGAFCFIGTHVVIGKNNHIGSYVVIDGNTTIGDNNSIGDHSVLGTAPQDIKTSSKKVGLRIGNNNHIGKRVFITAGTEHGGMMTALGSDNQLQDGIHIGHDVQMGNHCIMKQDAALGGHVTMGNHVQFGNNAAVHQFVKIGSHACLVDDAALTQDLPPYCRAEGNRSKIAGLCQDHLEKHFSTEVLADIKKAYMQLFTHASPKEQALKALEAQQPAVSTILYRFITDSERGVPFKRKTNVNEKM